MKNEGFLNPSTIEGALLYAFAFAAAAWLCGLMLRVAVERVLVRDKHDYFDRMAVKFIAKLLRYGVYVFAFVAYARAVPSLSGLSTASLTSISVITVVVGLAAQNTLGNLVAGISLLLYRPFKLGDRLQVMAPTGVETGTVENLTLGYTLLRTDDHRRVVVPNSLMASSTTINLTGDDSRVVCSVPFSISYHADIDHAREILLSLAAKHPKANAVVGCPLTQLGSSAIVLTLDVWCSDALTAISLRCDLLEQATKRFAADGIGGPFPPTLLVWNAEAKAPPRWPTRPAAAAPPGEL
ncbi:MAG: mechanosensitive ion channel family protein [Opitutus sp.]